MTPLSLNLSTCHRCRKVRPGPGVFWCTAREPVNIVDRARAASCPLGLHVTVLPEATDDHTPETEKRRIQQGGCCGTPSQ